MLFYTYDKYFFIHLLSDLKPTAVNERPFNAFKLALVQVLILQSILNWKLKDVSKKKTIRWEKEADFTQRTATQAHVSIRLELKPYE